MIEGVNSFWRAEIHKLRENYLCCVDHIDLVSRFETRGRWRHLWMYIFIIVFDIFVTYLQILITFLKIQLSTSALDR